MADDMVRVQIKFGDGYPDEDMSPEGQRVKRWVQGSGTLNLLHLLRWIAEELRKRGTPVN